MFFTKNHFLLLISVLSIPIELWESIAAIFWQSAGYAWRYLVLIYRYSSFGELNKVK